MAKSYAQAVTLAVGTTALLVSAASTSSATSAEAAFSTTYVVISAAGTPLMHQPGQQPFQTLRCVTGQQHVLVVDHVDGNDNVNGYRWVSYGSQGGWIANSAIEKYDSLNPWKHNCR